MLYAGIRRELDALIVKLTRSYKLFSCFCFGGEFPRPRSAVLHTMLEPNTLSSAGPLERH